MQQNHAKYWVNEREVEIINRPNGKTKPIKVNVKPLKGLAGKVNLKFYDVNSKGSATIMVSKVSDGTTLHVKSLAFKIIKFLIDGIIDGEILEEDLMTYRKDSGKI